MEEETQSKTEDKFKPKNKNLKSERMRFKNWDINDNNIFPSEEELFHVRNKLTIKEVEDIKNNDNIKNKDISDNNNNNNNNNININSDKENIKIEENKGFIGKGLEWINYIFHEIPLFWKKEELVKGYDANGNIVYRPKKKIPTKVKNNNDIERINAENEANSAGVDYSTKGINYGIYFN